MPHSHLAVTVKWVQCYCGVGVRLLGHYSGVSMKLVGTWKIRWKQCNVYMTLERTKCVVIRTLE